MGRKLFLCCLLLIGPPAAAADSPAADAAKAYALRALGVQYRYGGMSPETGFDCSGLVAHVFSQAWGIALPRHAQEQARLGTPVRRLAELQPGDLLFYNTRNRPYSHVGIYIGEGLFVHAPRPGRTVRYETIDSPYWRARFNGARRLSPPPPRTI